MIHKKLNHLESDVVFAELKENPKTLIGRCRIMVCNKKIDRKSLEKKIRYQYRQTKPSIDRRYFEDQKSDIFIVEIPETFDLNLTDKPKVIDIELYIHQRGVQEDDNLTKRERDMLPSIPVLEAVMKEFSSLLNESLSFAF